MTLVLSESVRRELQQKLKFDTIRVTKVNEEEGSLRLEFYEGHQLKGHQEVTAGRSPSSWTEIRIAEGSLKVVL